MKTVVLLGVLVLLLLFLNWRNPTEHMTLVKGIPVVEQADVNALLALWRPDPIIVKKQADDKAIMDKVKSCLNGRMNDGSRNWNERMGYVRLLSSVMNYNGTDEEKVKFAQGVISESKC